MLSVSTLSPTTTASYHLTDRTLAAPSQGKLISDRVREDIELIVGYWIVLFLSALGVVTNGLTLAVFLRQGFRDSVNVSLFSIAVWDQIKSLSGVLYRLYKPIGLANPVWGVIYKWTTRSYLVYLSIFAGNVSYGLATYVSVERCLSVSMPFRVRTLITPGLTSGFMVAVSLLIFGSFSPTFLIYEVVFVFSTHYNATVAARSPSQLYYAHGGIIPKLYKFLGIFYPAVFCTVMTVSSAVTVYHLRKSSANFRKPTQTTKTPGGSAVSPKASTNVTNKEAKVTKMLLVVILVYLMDFFPRLCIYVASLIEPEYFIYKKYNNVWLVTSNLVWILDFTNASVNFFIFMGMSTKFRKTFYEIFPRCEGHKKNEGEESTT